MSEMRELMLRTLDRIAADTLSAAVRDDAEADGRSPTVPGPLVAPVVAALREAGFFELGGTGSEGDVEFADAMAIARRAAYHALPVALGEIMVARWLATVAGLAVPEGQLNLVTGPSALSMFAEPSIALGEAIEFVGAGPGGPILLAGTGAEGQQQLLLVDAGSATAHVAQNVAGERRYVCQIAPPHAEQRIVAAADRPTAAADVYAAGALLRSVQMAGALDRLLEHCLLWVNDRVQFGRPIARFQAIQHQIAILASEAAAAGAATDQAIEASAKGPDRFAVAIAKARVGEAAGKAANIAHAAFGAMGFTREHMLHYTTRRLWSWRNEFGSEVYWQAELGRLVAASGGKRLWRLLNGE
jgi:acyl-CoA dehydrogenase